MPAKPRVLVVDDEPHMLEALQHWFHNADCEALCAPNGEEAFRILQDPPGVDVVLTDFMMPELNGIELVRVIKASNKLFDAKVVVMTNNADPEFRKRAMELGASAYLLKTEGARAIARRVIQMIHGGEPANPASRNQPKPPAEVQTMQQSLLALIRLTAMTSGLPSKAVTALAAAEDLAERLFGPESHS